MADAAGAAWSTASSRSSRSSYMVSTTEKSMPCSSPSPLRYESMSERRFSSSSGWMVSLSMQRSTFSSRPMWSLCRVTTSSSSSSLGGGFCFFFTLPCSSSISYSNSSTLAVKDSTLLLTHSRASSLAFSLGSAALGAPARPAIFISRSHTLKRSISFSILFRASINGCLSLISAPAIHALICSRRRCSFLISFFSSPSSFSRWLLLSHSCTCCHSSSNSSCPSWTFLRVRSISPFSFLSAAILSAYYFHDASSSRLVC
mmetsp:Transcript_7952/g.19879  ORF Transcript_7952/g.19879 Transcript_7952/m.19879 type:complete len:259 (-) Transcript_7952:74-850(-)